MSAVILVASGDAKRLRRLTRLVDAVGAVPVASANARDAIRLFHQRAPDLALLYVDPEEGIGLELCRDMRTLRGSRKRSIVVVAQPEFRREALEAGCDAFVPRQADIDPLEHAVRRLLIEAPQHRLDGFVRAVGGDPARPAF